MTAPNRPLHFLLVDDDPLILMSLSELIQDMGHETVDADHPTAALACLAGGLTIDVMLTDLKLPTMSGQELAEKVRPLKPDLPIIIITGYDKQKIGNALRDPFMRYLQKPFGKKELDNVLLSIGLIDVGRV